MEDHEHCPSSKSGKHYFQVAQVKSVFEPYYFSFAQRPSDDVGELVDHLPELYEKMEYSYMYCNCGECKRVLVKDA